jgi:hypothetical protein
MVVRGELICSKEEAATLAGIQLHLEEAWPTPENTTHISQVRTGLNWEV